MSAENQMGIDEAKVDAPPQVEAALVVDPLEQKRAARKAKNEAAREALAEDQGEIEKFLANADIGAIATNTDLRARFIISTSARLGIPVVPGAILLLTTDGKVVVYYSAVCASLIRNAKGWSSRRLEASVVDGVYEVWVRVWDPEHPEHYADNVGTMPMVDGLGEKLSPSVRGENMKKAYTQAERRATLSLAGVGGGDVKEDNAGPAWYPEQSIAEGKELKVVQPQPRQVQAIPPTATAPAPGEEVVELPPTPAAAPKRRVVRRKDGTVVPQPHAAGGGASPAPAPKAPPASAEPRQAGQESTQQPAEAPEVVQAPAVAQEPPQAAPAPACGHPGMQNWLRTAPAGKTFPCPDCEEVLTAPGQAPKPAESAPPPPAPTPSTPGACTHPALKNGKPGHTYACPPPPEGCGEDVRIPGERADKPAVATTPLPVRPRNVKIVKRTSRP
jgi:hypothetical protein